MKKRIACLLMQFLFLLFVSSAASAQTYSTLSVQRVFSQQGLDQMLAPVALYPDSLLSQILMAATYPPEVAQAADWSRANPHLRGDAAVNAVSGFYWEPSVKSMVAFPEILSVMGARMDWTTNLGDAFLGQQAQVMDTIQYLRRKALATGALRSNEHIRVYSQGGIIVIEPAVQQVVYVPYYDPTVVYGTWWWPNYAPVYWEPWPGYYHPRGYQFAWGAGVPIGVGLFFGYFDWSHRHVYVRPNKRWDYWRNYDNRRRHEWHHNPEHRHGTPYRSETVRRRYEASNDRNRGRRDESPARIQQDRQNLRGHAPERGRDSMQNRSGRPVSIAAPRPGATSGAQVQTATKPGTPAAVSTTPAARGAAVQQRAAVPGRAERRPSAFEGMEKGRDDRNYGARGRSSSREAGNGSRAARPASPRPPAAAQGQERSQSRGGSGPSRKD